jgi:heme/copper-type cytochrome/quinol oxidase subunit 1
MTVQTQIISKMREATQGGFLSWTVTVDHKRIGILYLLSASLFFLVGGFEALLMRIQLAQPDSKFLSPDMYNQIFTMHGTTMIFLVVMPLSAGFGNYLIPLMIGARDMTFPKLNALSYWTFLFGGLFMYSSFIFGGAPNDGWFSYAPLTEKHYSPTHFNPPTLVRLDDDRYFVPGSLLSAILDDSRPASLPGPSIGRALL